MAEMGKVESIYHEAAVRLIDETGYEGALRVAKRYVNMAESAVSREFHLAVVREIKKLREEYES